MYKHHLIEPSHLRNSRRGLKNDVKREQIIGKGLNKPMGIDAKPTGTKNGEEQTSPSSSIKASDQNLPFSNILPLQPHLVQFTQKKTRNKSSMLTQNIDYKHISAPNRISLHPHFNLTGIQSRREANIGKPARGSVDGGS